MNIHWTEAERQFIAANAARMKDDEIALTLSKHLGRYVSVHAVRKVRQMLGIRKKCGRGVCGVVNPAAGPATNVGLNVSGRQ
jgi:hypothetical protein